MNRNAFAILWIALQSCAFVGWAGYEELRLTTGKSILVRTAPVDPRDLLRGQYMRLSYEFSRGRGGLNAQTGQAVWVVLQPATDGSEFYVPTSYHDAPPRLRPAAARRSAVIRGRVTRRGLDFGIEKLFVQEGTETPPMRDVTVRLRVGTDQRPRIEQVYVKGKPWP